MREKKFLRRFCDNDDDDDDGSVHKQFNEVGEHALIDT